MRRLARWWFGRRRRIRQFAHAVVRRTARGSVMYSSEIGAPRGWNRDILAALRYAPNHVDTYGRSALSRFRRKWRAAGATRRATRNTAGATARGAAAALQAPPDRRVQLHGGKCRVQEDCR